MHRPIYYLNKLGEHSLHRLLEFFLKSIYYFTKTMNSNTDNKQSSLYMWKNLDFQQENYFSEAVVLSAAPKYAHE